LTLLSTPSSFLFWRFGPPTFWVGLCVRFYRPSCKDAKAPLPRGYLFSCRSPFLFERCFDPRKALRGFLRSEPSLPCLRRQVLPSFPNRKNVLSPERSLRVLVPPFLLEGRLPIQTMLFFCPSVFDLSFSPPPL